MAKRTVYLHLGPAVPGITAPHEALRDHPVLVAAGVALPALDQQAMDRADVEIRRRHKAVGVRRKDVEGAWAKVCRKAYKLKGDVLVSQPDFLDADPDQVALAMDGLVGMRLHVIVTPAAQPEGAAAADLVGPWAAYVKKASRIHVLPVGEDPTADALAADLARVVLEAREAEVERRLLKLTKQRRRIRERLTRVDAA
ncbi:hypothetical protein ASG88_20645 [Nocardioides sp. Soil777]|uniref:hypothetical protein n=1 Tax=Nocardioides sp. Soil777 TaxID=1736409 RepID=UPI0007036D15|nr:hypothetical protein [Nocardioides sp. Soil777]KRF05904.1 hypothetical protein ASG88_20645 [Nocardioides sp. Soil777]